MSWQKKARFGIAIFVVVFVAIVVVAMRQRKQTPAQSPPPTRKDPGTVAETRGGILEQWSKDKKLVFSLKFDHHSTYPDGRTKWRGVTLTLPDRNGRTFVVNANEGERLSKPGQDVGAVRLTGDVTLTTSDGAVIKAADATYDDASGMLQVPGPVTFTRKRMTGSGVGATYDKNRDVLWLLDQAHVVVTADEKGQGAIDATAGAIGLARADHYLRLSRVAHIVGEGREIDADEVTIHLTEDDERVRLMELRANSRVTGGSAGGAPQAMSARDMDLTYGEDGRALQHALLMENGVVQLPGEGRGPGKRIAGKTIDIAMAPDGATVTNLSATEAVQVDLPGEADAPAKRINSTTLTANGAPGTGLQTATFGGSVVYRETRAARGRAAAIDRTARAASLTVKTKPGLGAIQEADFHGHAHITDGPSVVADAPRVVYFVERDQMDLSPGSGEPGIGPRVSDARVSVDARAISLTLGSRKLVADTDVRTVMQPQRPAAQGGRGGAPQPAGASTTKVPSMLEQDQPVNVTSNRIAYDGAAGHAMYSGNAKLFQGQTKLFADTIIVDDKTGNLEARGTVQTWMVLVDVNAKTGERTRTVTEGKADTFVYDDAKRLATYTTNARLVGSEGDIAADKLELFLKAGENSLERMEGYGTSGSVMVKNIDRDVTGDRLTYTAKTETYDMTGKPVVTIEIKPNDCSKSESNQLVFQKAVDTITLKGNEAQLRGVPVACPAGRQ